MNVLDLFSGACGGWSLGLHRAGFRTVAAVEIDEWRRRQFGRNNPGAKLYDDVRTVTAARLAADGIGPIGLVCGSPPCQDASSANTKGRGIDGERTGLYMEAVRIVREIRPRWCAFENVPGIRNRGIDRVLSKLEEADYAAWPLVVGALDLGAPHIRKRSWVVGADAKALHWLAQPWDQPNGNYGIAPAIADEAQWGPKHQARNGHGPNSHAQRPEGSNGPAGGPDTADAEEGPGWPRSDIALTELETRLSDRLGPIAETWNGGIAGRLRVDDGLPKGTSQPLLAAYGDAILPIIAQVLGQAIMTAEGLLTPR